MSLHVEHVLVLWFIDHGKPCDGYFIKPCYTLCIHFYLHFHSFKIIFYNLFRVVCLSQTVNPGWCNSCEGNMVWREAVAGIVFSDVPISNCMNYATYCLIRFTIGVFYNIYTPFQQFGVLICLILP